VGEFDEATRGRKEIVELGVEAEGGLGHWNQGSGKGAGLSFLGREWTRI
jgi:hypothetical protein